MTTTAKAATRGFPWPPLVYIAAIVAGTVLDRFVSLPWIGEPLSGMLVIGIGLIAQVVWFLPLALIASFLVQKLAIEREERRLQQRFGKKYGDYARRVRRWI